MIAAQIAQSQHQVDSMSEAEPVRRAGIPEFVYKGFRFPEAEMARDIDSLRRHKPAYELCEGSATLAEIAVIYELALTAQMGEAPIERPEEAAKAALSIYDNIHSRIETGEWTDDAADYHNTRRLRGVIVPENYIPVRWIKHPSFKKGPSGWEADLREGSEEFYVFLPADGFVIPTIDGLYRPDTGTPFATEEDKGRATMLLERACLDGKEASYFWRSHWERGVYAVSRRHYPSHGPFAIHVKAEPDFVDDCIGARPMRRLGVILQGSVPPTLVSKTQR